MLMVAPCGIFTYWEIDWYVVQLDLYLLGDRFERLDIKRELDRKILMETCLMLLTSLYGISTVWEIWSSIAWELSFLSLLIGISIEKLWD